MNNTFKKSVVSVFAGLSLLSSAFAADGDFALTGNIQTQGEKKFYDNESDNPLDNFWFRGNFGGKYSSDNFDAQMVIRLYAPNSNKGSDRFQADTYWGNYKWKLDDQVLSLKLGHWKTDWSVGGNFGTYLDPNLGTRGYLARDFAHDGFELGWKAGISNLLVMVATNDNTGGFSTGYIRVEEKLKFEFPLEATIGYRVNAIDPIAHTAVLTHRAALKLDYKILPNFRVYAEGGLIITGKDDNVNDNVANAVLPEYGQDTKYFPVYGGIDIPTMGLLNNLLVEVEYIKDRSELTKTKVPGNTADDIEDLAWAVALVKNIGSRTKAQLSFFSEDGLGDVAMGLRFTTTIK
ncbi:MAG: hypothetical protein LBR60_00330 [Fibrobacter sp.]|jgi:hypothetical protein|nr:hypothetical protein [Fibrobacter sp.]